MSRTTKILGFSVPPSMVEEVEQIAQEERRTKSELFREMLRVYQAYRQHRSKPEVTDPRTRTMALGVSGEDAPA
jgi:metal-responsive CopG/Arc/MetJ family transcriptional regulator